MLKVTGLKKLYGKNKVLDNVSITLLRGNIYGLLGPNGCGKTTLLKAIAGLVSCEGDILIEGVKNKAELKERIAFLPTVNHFFYNMTVADSVTYYERFYRDFQKEDVLNRLKELKIDLDKEIHRLSTGELAKLKIALVLGRDTKVYLLDEPFNGIDLSSRKEISRMLLEMFHEERIIVITTHIVEEIEELVDGVLFMKNRTIIRNERAENIRYEYGKSIVEYYEEVLS